MDTSVRTTEQAPTSDVRSVSGKVFVVVFVALCVLIAGIGTSLRLTVRPKYRAAVASSSAKVAEDDAKAAAAASAKPQATPQK